MVADPVGRKRVAKTVVVNFWNSWCIPCHQEHEALVEFYNRHAGEPGFAAARHRPERHEAAIRGYVEPKVDWPVAFDPGQRAALDFGTRANPRRT